MASQQGRQHWIFHFKYEEQVTAVMGSKRTEGRVWRGSRGLHPSFREESLKSHQMFLLQLELTSSAMQRLPHHSYHATSGVLPCHSK